MDKKKTGELIKKARNENGFTQAELGNLIGVSNKAISRWENGESFPDIGVLEILAKTLGVRIQDIILGEVTVTDEESTVIDIVKEAKSQEQNRNKKRMIIAMVGIVLLAYLLFRGMFMVNNYQAGIWTNTLCFYSLPAVLLVISIQAVTDCKTINPLKDKKHKVMCILSCLSGLYGIILLCTLISMISAGRTPFGMELTSVGPFLNNQLMLIYIINIVIGVIVFKDIYMNDEHVKLDIYIAVGVMHLMLSYSDMLYSLSSVEEVHGIIIKNTITVVVEVIVVIVVMLFGRYLYRRDAKKS